MSDLNLETASLQEIYSFLQMLQGKVSQTLDIIRDVDVITHHDDLAKLEYVYEFVSQQFHLFSTLRQCLNKYEKNTASLTKEDNHILQNNLQLLDQIELSANNIRMVSHRLKQTVPVRVNNIKQDTSYTDYYTPITEDKNYKVNDKTLANYQATREQLAELHKKLIFVDPENMFDTIGRRLEIKNGNSLFIETEHEMNLFVDVGIFQYRKNGKNIAERLYEQQQNDCSPEKLELLLALKNARFCLLDIIKPIKPSALVAYDRLQQKELLLVDNGLSNVACDAKRYVILTHYICLPDFAMTTGASTPVLVSSSSGKKMLDIFDKLVKHHQNEELLQHKDYLQIITELFKIAIHDDVAKAVHSNPVPFGHKQINKTKH